MSKVIISLFVLCALCAVCAWTKTSSMRSRLLGGFKQGMLSTARGFGKRGPTAVHNAFDGHEEVAAVAEIERALAEVQQAIGRRFLAHWIKAEVFNNPKLEVMMVRKLAEPQPDDELDAGGQNSQAQNDSFY